MHQKGLLTYALNSIGNLVYIDEVDTGQLCNCYCPSCKEKLVVKNGGMKRVHHFARKHSKKCTFYTLRFGCSFAAVNTIKPQLL